MKPRPYVTMAGMRGWILVEGWFGRRGIRCEIVRETPKRYEVLLLEDGTLPRRRMVATGDRVLIPQTAFTINRLEVPSCQRAPRRSPLLDEGER